MSAMPIGMPGWPELAFCTASIASARIALAISTRVASRDRAEREPSFIVARLEEGDRIRMKLDGAPSRCLRVVAAGRYLRPASNAASEQILTNARRLDRRRRMPGTALTSDTPAGAVRSKLWPREEATV